MLQRWSEQTIDLQRWDIRIGLFLQLCHWCSVGCWIQNCCDWWMLFDVGAGVDSCALLLFLTLMLMLALALTLVLVLSLVLEELELEQSWIVCCCCN